MITKSETGRQLPKNSEDVTRWLEGTAPQPITGVTLDGLSAVVVPGCYDTDAGDGYTVWWGDGETMTLHAEHYSGKHVAIARLAAIVLAHESHVPLIDGPAEFAARAHEALGQSTDSWAEQ